MISVTRKQLEQASRDCEDYAAPDARLWRVVLRTPPAFDENPNAPAELSKEPDLEFERVGGQWRLRGSVRLAPDFAELVQIRARNLTLRDTRRWNHPMYEPQLLRIARPHVVIYREA